MRTRLAIIATLALGIAMTGTSATLAVSGLAGQNNTAQTVYPKGIQELPPAGNEQGGQNALPETIGDTEDGVVEGAQQIAAGDDGRQSLPFTGILAIPLLLGGVGLVLTGALMHRSARRRPSA